MNNNVTILNHSLLKHKMAIIRDKDTKTKEFRQTVSEIGSLMAYEVTKELSLREITIETPICKTKAYILEKDVVIVPIMRAGMGMVDGFVNLIPEAKVGHIGLYRDEETLEPHTYYEKFPENFTESTLLIVDPMLATGGSAIAAIDILKKYGCKNITFVGLVGAPFGLDALTKAHPDVRVYLGALDEKLNEKGYIVPGLGDCGDRIFGTK